MKLKGLCVISLALAIFFQPMQMYSNWHLKTFSEGLFYTLLNVTYLPYNYKIDSWIGMINVNEPVPLKVNHRYKGKYNIYIMGAVVKNIHLNYVVDISCGSGELLSFNSKDIKASQLNRENNNEIQLGTYLVEDLYGYRDCMVELTAENFDSPIGLRFLKRTHW